MKRILFTALSLLVFLVSKAGDGEYAVDKIPAELLKHAHAVKRFEEIRFEVINVEKARYYRRVAYTILDEKGDDFADFVENYDKLESIESIEGRLFDAGGKKLKSLKKGDVQDKSG